MKVMLTVTGPGPLWTSRSPSAGNFRSKPDAVKFAAFATAVAKRYGDRVDRYILWNEPNLSQWLQPQSSCSKGRCTPVAPHLYRDLVRAAYPAIRAADPGAQVLAGALAPRGYDVKRNNDTPRPLAFLRAMGCVDAKFRRLRSGFCAGFQPATADGFAYHPHGIRNSPDHAVRQPATTSTSPACATSRTPSIACSAAARCAPPRRASTCSSTSSATRPTRPTSCLA